MKVNLRIVELANARYLTRPSEWPSDVRWVIEAVLRKQSGYPNNTSPRFVVVLEGEIITTAFGRNGWKHYIVPALTKLVGP